MEWAVTRRTAHCLQLLTARPHSRLVPEGLAIFPSLPDRSSHYSFTPDTSSLRPGRAKNATISRAEKASPAQCEDSGRPVYYAVSLLPYPNYVFTSELASVYRQYQSPLCLYVGFNTLPSFLYGDHLAFSVAASTRQYVGSASN